METGREAHEAEGGMEPDRVNGCRCAVGSAVDRCDGHRPASGREREHPVELSYSSCGDGNFLW